MMGRYPRLGPLRRPGSRDHAAVAQALELVGMTAHARRQIGAPSGGPGRRGFLARAPALPEPLAYEFFVRALAASILVGLVCAVIGTYMVLRGLAFMGDALSHAAFPGVVAAYLLQLPFYLGATVAAVGTALAIGWIPPP